MSVKRTFHDRWENRLFVMPRDWCRWLARETKDATAIYFIDDAWGGYWQCAMADGSPYTFRRAAKDPLHKP